MTFSILRGMLFVLPLFAFNLHAQQTYCDDLTVLQPYSLLPGSLLNITDTISFGDTISTQNAYNVIELGGTYSDWYYVSNLGIHDGISGDAHFKVKPVNEVENLSVTIYNSTDVYGIPTFVVNGDTSNFNSSLGFNLYELSDFPMTVGNMNISIDTNVASLVCSNGIAHSGYKLICNGPIEELELFFGIDVGYIYEVCYESNVLNILESEDIQVLYPNPASEYFQIQSTIELTSVSIYNILGEKVVVVPLHTTQYKVDCSQLTTGVYLVVLENIDGKQYTEKITIRR